MQQYAKIKGKYPDAILLFRVGDFYETFGEDAIKTSKTLGIVLTRRNNGGSDIELAGFPHHSLDLYLPKLVKAGYRVAICDQLEKPSKEKKIVKRGVTEMVTPGVTTEDTLLDHRKNNFLASVHFAKHDQLGIAFLDISTGEFLISEGDVYQIDKLLQSFEPSEVIFAKSHQKQFDKHFGSRFYTYPLDEWIYTLDFTREKLLDHFEVQTLKGYSVEDLEYAQIAAGASLHYLATTENDRIRHISSIQRIHPDAYMWMDRFTIRNLELIHASRANGTSLLEILDETISPMGSRLLTKWLLLPLLSIHAIRARHEAVDSLIADPDLQEALEKNIRQIGDLERLMSKASVGKINPRETKQLHVALTALVPIRDALGKSDNDGFQKMADRINLCTVLRDKIERAIQDDPPVSISKGNVLREGYNEELDELRDVVANTQEMLLTIQQEEAKKTGITSLKIGFNNVFGYYLEVTNKYKNQGLIPDNWVRKQTLTNSERYVTDELKKLEQKILGAQEKISALEEELYESLVEDIQEYIQPNQENAQVVAEIDCLISFSRLAVKNNYCRPQMNEEFAIEIKAGRHPVIEKQLPLDETYVPNDIYMDCDTQQILMITGPNMSGKSALLRQTALISIMAQIGSFVPAKQANLGIVDKLFTRVGASDSISSGESTFMVEMNETASIMNNMSPRSLILLDEIGRGTSTYDGISIAWSVAEFLHNNQQAHPKTLFATHYHELNDLSDQFRRIKNFHIATKEVGNKVLFLRKLTPGGSEHSFGIHVAQMAGMPRSIILRAAEILKRLEENSLSTESNKHEKAHIKEALNTPSNPALQLSIFETVDPALGKVKEMLLDLNVNTMTPVECMMQLIELKKIFDEEN